MSKTPNPIDEFVGSRVRVRRLTLKMSQEALADQLGLTFQQVQKYEKGTNRISASRLQEMSYILEVPVPLFFEGVPLPANQSAKRSGKVMPSYIEDVLATSQGHALVRAFAKITSAKLRGAVVELVEAMVAANDP